MHVGFGVAHFPVKDIRRIGLAGHPFGASGQPPEEPSHDLVWRALADALLGATGEGGLRQYSAFNETDHEIDSSLMAGIERQIHYAGWKVINADVTLSYPGYITPETNLLPIRETVAKTLFINTEQVNIKDTRFPGDVNSSHYITCYAIVFVGPRDL